MRTATFEKQSLAVSGHQWHSVVLGGHQWRSVAISGHPGSSSSLIIITCDARRQVSEVVDGVRPAVREPHETCDAADPIEAPRSHGPQRRHPRRRLTEGGVQEHAGRCLAFKCRGLTLDEPQEDSIGSQIARGVVDLGVTSSVTSSVALRGTQWHSEALRGTQRRLEALSGTHLRDELIAKQLLILNPGHAGREVGILLEALPVCQRPDVTEAREIEVDEVRIAKEDFVDREAAPRERRVGKSVDHHIGHLRRQSTAIRTDQK